MPEFIVLEKCFDFLLPEMALKREKKGDYKGVSEANRLRIIVMSLAIWSILALVGAGVRMWQFGLNSNVKGLMLFFACSVSILLYIKKNGSLENATALVHVLLLIALPHRIYMTGGIGSPAVYLLCVHCILGHALNGRKVGRALIVYSLALCFLFYLMQEKALIAPVPYYEDPLVFGLFISIVALFIIAPIGLVLRGKNRLEKMALKIDKRELSEFVVENIAAKVQSEVTIALSIVHELEKEGSSDRSALLKESLWRVEQKLRAYSGKELFPEGKIND